METIYINREDLTKQFVHVECPNCREDIILSDEELEDIEELENKQALVTHCPYCGLEIDLMLP